MSTWTAWLLSQSIQGHSAELEGDNVPLQEMMDHSSDAGGMILSEDPESLAGKSHPDYGSNCGDSNKRNGDLNNSKDCDGDEGLMSHFFTATSSITSTEEDMRSASVLLEEEHAKFNPHCLFESESWGTGTASIANEVTNLVKNIVGAGGLSIPAGIAAFGSAPSAIVPAIVVILLMGLINAYSFSLLGRVCAVTQSKSYSLAWDRTVGRRHGTQYNWCVDWVVTGKALLGTWSFSIVIASTCQPLMQLVWVHLLGVGGGGDGDTDVDTQARHGTVISKSQVLLVITAIVLLPLCILERLGSLAFFSVIGQMGTVITVVTMTVRYIDGTYLEGGKFYGDLSDSHRPLFGSNGALAFFSPQSLVLISILSTGYVAHYNAPKYYFELKDHTTGRFNVVVNSSFLLAAVTYVVVSSLGFLTFGAHSAGFILDNYSYRDPLATLARFGVALSVIFAYPLLFHGGRDSLLEMWGRHNPTPWEVRLVTALLLSIVTTLAISVNNLTFVVSFSGATMSSLIIYIFPPLMFGAFVKNCTCMATYRTNWEVKESVAMMVVGGTLGVCGAVVTVIRTFF